MVPLKGSNLLNYVYPLWLNLPDTARKTIFPRSWNITEGSKRPRKYLLSINFLAEKKTVFPIRKSSKQELLSNQYISSFHQLLNSKQRPYFQSPKSSKQELSSNQ